MALAALLVPGAFAAAAPIRVRFENGKLWVSAQAVPAPEVFSAIAEKTGVRFVIDSELKPGSLSVDIEGVEIERAVRSLIAEIPQAAGHTMSYSRESGGATQLREVAIYGPGKAPSGGNAAVYEATSAPAPAPTPDLQERMEKMIEAGVPRQTAEKVVALTQEVQRLQATPAPGSYRAEDLSPASREQLQPLLDRGVPLERAVQMLLLQEKYQDTLRELSAVQGGLNLPGGIPAPPPLPATGENQGEAQP